MIVLSSCAKRQSADVISAITPTKHFMASIAGQHAQAAETATTTQLSCSRLDGPREGFVVNMTDRTVSGFGIVAHIESTDDTSISFNGEGPFIVESGPNRGKRLGTNSLTGTLDRITGALRVVIKFELTCPAGISDCSSWKGTTTSVFSYNMVCKAANRLF
jgi:hypothetical protein